MMLLLTICTQKHLAHMDTVQSYVAHESTIVHISSTLRLKNDTDVCLLYTSDAADE